ncbi:hypothetical protein JTB14_030247 [Gonioctena quinquepunctata]|nr:hypothetical protein JTB14_030247 [Gonioctena quinquepunctata]
MVESSPFCICLQETHLKPKDSFNLRGFKLFRRDVEPGARAHGGIAIFIKNNFPATEIPLRTDIQALAVHIDYPYKMTICNIYLPNTDWTLAAFENIIEQLPSPFLIMGDFNSHNPIWGSHKLDAGGRIIERVIDDRDLVVINNGQDSMEDMEQVLQENIDALVNLADSIGFCFSPNKTKCMHFCRLRKPHNEPSLTLYGNILEVVPYFKFLGVTLDQKLHWKEHIDMLATKCKKNMNIMKAVSNISWGMDREILLKMYSTLILSKIDYGCIVYGAARKSHLKQLDSIQGTCLRLAIGHIGIAGNESADQAAKEAADSDTYDDIPVRPSDLKVEIKMKIIQQWQRQWNTTDTKLKEIKRTVHKWEYGSLLKRREQVAISRLRMGHTFLTNSFMLLNDRQPRCEVCQNTP